MWTGPTGAVELRVFFNKRVYHNHGNIFRAPGHHILLKEDEESARDNHVTCLQFCQMFTNLKDILLTHLQ